MTKEIKIFQLILEWIYFYFFENISKRSSSTFKVLKKKLLVFMILVASLKFIIKCKIV